MKAKLQELSAQNLKSVLWETLHAVKDKKISPREANAVAMQSGEILKVMKLELQVLGAASKKPGTGLLGFTSK